jgi:hypothetical protein
VVKKQIADRVGDLICNQIRDLIERQVWCQSRGFAWLRVSYQAEDPVKDQVWDQVWHRTWAQAEEDINDAGGSTSRA